MRTDLKSTIDLWEQGVISKVALEEYEKNTRRAQQISWRISMVIVSTGTFLMGLGLGLAIGG